MENIPVFKPILPPLGSIAPYIEQIDKNRYYSNLGPLTKSFEERMANHFGIAKDRLVTSTNGTLALTQILQALDAKPGSLCVMPSWTFVATPASAMAAGLIPYFIDVDEENWVISPDDVHALMKHEKVGAVIVVAPFGGPIDLTSWQKLHEQTGIPVIIDAAAGFDGFSKVKHQASNACPIMISLHATKVFGVGEGAVVLTSDAELARRIQMFGNYGFYNSREAMLPGTNAKLNEYMSAVGMAAMDNWKTTREKWQKISDIFERYVVSSPDLSLAPNFNKGWISSYGNVRFASPYDAPKIKDMLEECHINALSWWGKGCHRHRAYQDCPRSDLPRTDYLGSHVLGLPFWLGLEESDFEYIFSSLQKVMIKSLT